DGGHLAGGHPRPSRDEGDGTARRRRISLCTQKGNPPETGRVAFLHRATDKGREIRLAGPVEAGHPRTLFDEGLPEGCGGSFSRPSGGKDRHAGAHRLIRGNGGGRHAVHALLRGTGRSEEHTSELQSRENL